MRPFALEQLLSQRAKLLVMEHLKNFFRSPSITTQLTKRISVQPNQNVQQILLGIPSVEKVEIQSSNHQTLSFVILAKQGKLILKEFKESLDQHNVKIAEIYVEKGCLDEVFHQMTIVEAA